MQGPAALPMEGLPWSFGEEKNCCSYRDWNPGSWQYYIPSSSGSHDRELPTARLVCRVLQWGTVAALKVKGLMIRALQRGY